MLQDIEKYSYKLPCPDGSVIEHSLNYNSVVIIGANGSGKTKLSAWMEEKDPEKIHRIGAQRSLNFKKKYTFK